MHDDLENSETTLRVKISTVLLLAWSIVSLAVIANFTWTYIISNKLGEHTQIDDARVARIEAIVGSMEKRFDTSEANQLSLIRSQERVLQALKIPK